MSNGVTLLINEDSGQFIPFRFANEFCTKDNIDNGVIKNVDQEDLDILLSGPDNEQYWDVWDDVLQTVEIEFGNNTYKLMQEGDLFMLCFDEMSPEEYKNFDLDGLCDYRHFEEDELVKEFEEMMEESESLDKSDNIMMSQEFANWMSFQHEEGLVTNYQVQNFCYPDD